MSSDTKKNQSNETNICVSPLAGKIIATDADLTGHLQYLAEDSRHFKVDKETGEIQLISLLDREKIDKYKLNIQVTDEIQYTNSTVEIEVILRNNEGQTVVLRFLFGFLGD